jgi:integrase
MKSLTVKGIAKLKIQKTEKGKPIGSRYKDPDSRGLYLQVGPNGNKSWLLRYELAGRERFMGLGSYEDFSLKQARERARSSRQLLADGIDPIDHRNAAKNELAAQARKAAGIPTFKEATEQYYKVHGNTWKNAKSRKQFLSSLAAYAYPTLANLKVNEITTEDVRLALEPHWDRIRQTASRTRGRIEGVLSWAIANRYCEAPNVARWEDNLEHLLAGKDDKKPTKHHASLAYVEMGQFWAKLNEQKGVAARALEFVILTATRSGEVLGAKWDEIDLKAKTWIIPEGRMKAGIEHRVPLSDRALELLKALPTEEGNDFVFIGRLHAGLGNLALPNVLERINDEITCHGFRSTFRTWASERTAFPHDVCEAALAHTVHSAVVRAYKRTDFFDQRRKLMAEWSKFCITKPVAATGGEVVPIRKAR